MLLLKSVLVLTGLFQISTPMVVDPRSSTFVKICFQKSDFNVTVVVVGVYLKSSYVLLQMDKSYADVSLWDDYKTSFYIGSDNMECSGEQYRKLVSATRLSRPGAILFKISKPFNVGRETTSLRISSNTEITKQKCYTYCTIFVDSGTIFRDIFTMFADFFDKMVGSFFSSDDSEKALDISELKDVTVELNVCDTLKSYDHDIVDCYGRNGKKETCITKNKDDLLGWFTESPVVCNEELVGFAASSEEDEVPITKISEYMDEIDKKINENSKWDIISKSKQLKI